MPTSVSANTRIQDLVSRVVNDIRSRGLRPGDRYLTTLEVARLFGVSTRSANDAMKFLAKQRVLLRRPKAGTIIGEAVPGDAESEGRTFDVIHLLIRQDHYFSERRRMDGLVTGISHELWGSAIQLNFVPVFNELAYVERLLDTPLAKRNAYIIAVKSPQVQERFERQTAPVVLLGTPFEGVKKLAWIDKDQAAIGRLLMAQLIAKGHKRIGVVLRDRRGHGDDLMMDAITHELVNSGLGQGSLTTRSVPIEATLISMVIRTLLTSEFRPTALICRTKLIATVASDVCQELRLKVGTDITLALCDPPADAEDVMPVPCVRLKAEINSIAEGTLLAQMLSQQGEKPAAKLAPHRIIAVTN